MKLMTSVRSRRLLASALSAALVCGTCAPAVALADTAAGSTTATAATTKAEALDAINAYMSLGLSKLSASQITEVVEYAGLLAASDYTSTSQVYFVYTVVNSQLEAAEEENDDLEAQVADLKSQLKEAQDSDAIEAAYEFGSLTITKLTATAGMGKATLVFTPSSTISGVKYQVKYRANGTKAWKTNTTNKKTVVVKGLTKDKTYTFKVRGVMQIGGEAAYTAFSKTASATVLPKYKTGSYKVTETMGLTVRTKASTTSGVVTALKYNTKVNVTKVLVGTDKNIWGKIKTGGKTGYVQMQYLKKA